MRKIFATILSICAFTAASVLPTAGLFSQKTAQASDQTTAKTCSAASHDYLAVARGTKLHLFNRGEKSVWQTYTHEENLSQLYFYGDDLYFVDRLSALYRLRADDFTQASEAVSTGITCSAFTIANDTLYFAQQDWIYQAPLADLSAETALFQPSSSAPASIGVFDGDLYYLYGQNYIYSWALDTQKDNGELSPIPSSTALTIAEGNAYLLTKDGDFLGYSLTDLAEKDTSTPVVEKSGATAPYSALSTDDKNVYAVQNGELYAYTAKNADLTKAAESDYATIDAVPLDTIKTDIQAATTTTVAIVKTTENALLMEVDLAASETVFRHLSNRRGSITGIRLAQNERYTLLASEEEGYKTYLVANDSAQTLSTGYQPLEKTGYAGGKCNIYKYPAVSDVFPTLASVERNAELTIVGEIEGVDGNYYAVQIGDQVGYIPQTHARLFDGSSPTTETLLLRNGESDKDSVWRLAYLLLGGVALCILADFLILRKRPKDD